ncbi:MAG: FAD-dependent oxidoreductase [Acidimicrobiia bacterium]|nr:FAD-dependent oxidoreductase [Acidimicrobiia bacterium]
MPHVVVVGAGVFGVWSAWHLRAAGARVTLVEAYEPGHSRSSSGDESRIVRCGYGADEIYSRFAMRSLRAWRDWAQESAPPPQAPLFHRCGVLWLSGADEAYVEATRRTLEAGGYGVQVLDRAALRDRFPQVVAEDTDVALLEPDCGVVMARRAVATLARQLERRDVPVVRGRARPGPDQAGRLRSVTLDDGSEIRGDAFVFACGAWLPKVFPELLGPRIRPTQQVVLYFGTPAGDERFGPRHMPAWVGFQSGVYGVPDLEGRGLKVGIDRHGPAFDPDADDRALDAASLEKARAWLARRLPGMADAPLVESRVCQYENTSNGDFLIDRHPGHANVWMAGGGSGHGFKHGPAVGEHVASLVLGSADVEPRFSLATKSTDAARSVY